MLTFTFFLIYFILFFFSLKLSLLLTSWFAYSDLWFKSLLILNYTVKAAFTLSTAFQFSSVAQLCPTLCDTMNHSTPGFPVRHWLLEFTQTHVHQVGDAIQPSHPLSSPSPLAFNLSQYQGLFKWVSSSHQMAKVSEFQLQHQSLQWIFRTDFL